MKASIEAIEPIRLPYSRPRERPEKLHMGKDNDAVEKQQALRWQGIKTESPSVATILQRFWYPIDEL